MSKNKFYITTSIMYANAMPHVGFAMELIQADVIARYQRMLLGTDHVRFLTGTDEHGTTVARAARKQGKEPQQLVDEVSSKVEELAKKLNISNDDFIRTTDKQRHWPGAKKIWKALHAAGTLYKKEYEGFYCVGHEAFIKKSELVDGLCPMHKTAPENIKEENWFFKLSDYKDEVKKRIRAGELQIMPETRKQEILNLLDDAEDVSFSRPSKDLSWGIPVPDDPSQTMYVWADALTNYISALSYGTDEKDMQFWPADVHLIGKDILRFHAMIWPAMLLAAGLPLPKAIYVHGFITVDGQKMSKTIGNVVDPFELLEKYDSEVIRYFLLREIPSGEDGDFSYKNLEARYNSDLANDLGNLVSRTMKMVVSAGISLNSNEMKTFKELTEDAFGKEFSHTIENFQLSKALDILLTLPEDNSRAARFLWMNSYYVEGVSSTMSVSASNARINKEAPYKEEDSEQKAEKIKKELLRLYKIGILIEPFLPETSIKILNLIKTNSMPEKPLFPRLT